MSEYTYGVSIPMCPENLDVLNQLGRKEYDIFSHWYYIRNPHGRLQCQGDGNRVIVRPRHIAEPSMYHCLWNLHIENPRQEVYAYSPLNYRSRTMENLRSIETMLAGYFAPNPTEDKSIQLENYRLALELLFDSYGLCDITIFGETIADYRKEKFWVSVGYDSPLLDILVFFGNPKDTTNIIKDLCSTTGRQFKGFIPRRSI